MNSRLTRKAAQVLLEARKVAHGERNALSEHSLAIYFGKTLGLRAACEVNDVATLNRLCRYTDRIGELTRKHYSMVPEVSHED